MPYNQTHWNSNQIENTFQYVCQNLSNVEIIHKNSNRLIVRHYTDPNHSVVVKLWARPMIKQKIRRFFHVSSVDYEWDNLNYFYQHGISVPTPLGFGYLPVNSFYTEGIIMEDIGNSRIATDYVKECLNSSQLDRLYVFEENLIKMTCAIINQNYLDIDHGLVNILATETGYPTRIDFEMARQIKFFKFHTHQYAQMLSTLLSTYTFAVQPHVERVSEFAKRLNEKLNIPKNVQLIAYKDFQKRMAKQKEEIGIDHNIQFPW